MQALRLTLSVRRPVPCWWPCNPQNAACAKSSTSCTRLQQHLSHRNWRVSTQAQGVTSEGRRSVDEDPTSSSDSNGPITIVVEDPRYDAYVDQDPFLVQSPPPPTPPPQRSEALSSRDGLPSTSRVEGAVPTPVSYDAYLEQQSDGFLTSSAAPQPPPVSYDAYLEQQSGTVLSEPIASPHPALPPPIGPQPLSQQPPTPQQPTPLLSILETMPPSLAQQADNDPVMRPLSIARRSIDDGPQMLADVDNESVAPGGDWLSGSRDDVLIFAYSVIIGGVVASSVFLFDVLIQTVHDLPDTAAAVGLGGGRHVGLPLGPLGAIPFRCVMPIGAGFVVAWLQGRGFAPPLKSLVRAIEGVVDDSSNAALPDSYWQVFRKACASAITLGSGASLGPEAPSVELGANTAAIIMPKHLNKRRKRMLIAAGAAAGVSAAFDAPVTGALFATEFVLKSSRLGLDRLSIGTVFVATSVSASVVGYLRAQGLALGIRGAATHLVGRIPYFSIQPNMLYEVVQFSVVGVGCAVVATALYEGVRISEIVLRPFPRVITAPVAGAVCGLLAYEFPQVQYGYINLEEVFRGSNMSAPSLFALLLAKIVATSVCVGGGLVGGLFAPSLFLGAIVGNIMGQLVPQSWGMVDPTSFIVVGAAAVLGASCRAPLTAMALMVEITRDTGLLVPLLSAIGISSLLADYAEGLLSKRLDAAVLTMYVQEKGAWWGALAATRPGEKPVDTVEQVIASAALLYVRHTLPLQQAKEAMIIKGSPAAVVVDDNFGPMGVVYLEDVETELVRKKMLLERDDNFNRS